MATNNIKQFQDFSLFELLNTIVSNISTENPIEYFDKIYSSVNPGMIMEAVEEGKHLVEIENEISKRSKQKKEKAEVYLTIGGDSLNKSFYTGIISTLLWLPVYIKEVGSRFGISEHNIETTLNVLKEVKLPQAHDVKEETVGNEKVELKPSNIRHYSAFLSSIVSWLSNGITNFNVHGLMKTNLEMCRYLTSVALESFPSVPFASYHLGSCETTDIFNLSEKMGKSFDWLKYMSEESYMLNEPKFVVTTPNAPIVGIVGHPLTETFIAEIKEGQAKWIGLFIETEEFGKICAQNGLSAEMIKKYIIGTSEKKHLENVKNKDPIALFIENQKITKQCFEWRHKYSSVQLDENENYEL